jgi:hypothetical protein
VEIELIELKKSVVEKTPERPVESPEKVVQEVTVPVVIENDAKSNED